MSNLINGFCLLTDQADAFTIASTNQTIAQVINVTPTDVSGAFVTLSEEQFAFG